MGFPRNRVREKPSLKPDALGQPAHIVVTLQSVDW
jgi:hypothetical protein